MAKKKTIQPKLRFKDDEGKDYPDWEEKTLGEVGEKFLNGGTPSTSVESFWNGDMPWITGADFDEQKINEVRKFITKDAIKKSSTNVVEKGNLLVVTRTGVGKIAIAPFDIAISQDITGVYLKKETAIPEYIFQLLIAKKKELQKNNQGTSINGIKREDLLKLKLAIPVIEEQKKIAEFLSAIDDKIENLEKELEELKAYKKGVMQAIFAAAPDATERRSDGATVKD